MIVRGYAIPYNQLGAVDDDGVAFEQIFEGAFDDMLAGKKSVVLQYASHGRVMPIAKTADGTLTLFSDQFGLGFEAHIGDRLDFESQLSIRRGAMSGASINFTKMVAQTGPAATRYVSQAEIDHIAITSQPAYRQTAVWPVDANFERAPARIWNAAAKWEKGWAEFQAEKKEMLANSTARAAAGNGRRVSSDCPLNFAKVNFDKLRSTDALFATFSPEDQRAIVRKNPQLWRAAPASSPVPPKRR